MSKFQVLYDHINAGNTLLGVGPMSKNCIDAAIHVANEDKTPLLLIASRRQVDAKALGGGYVMSTEGFCKYVKSKDKIGKYIFLARDHGGPWQGASEQDLNHLEAVAASNVSYLADIKSGMDIIHIDPSLKKRTYKEICNDVYADHRFCEYIRKKHKKDVIYEIGTEEHGGHITEEDKFKEFVQEFSKLENVNFVVGNMGLYVKETKNIGKFNDKQALKFVDICKRNGVFLKGHNSDYVLPSIIRSFSQSGVHAVNVAPEFGTLETDTLLTMLRNLKYYNYHDELVEMFYSSRKWEKWITKNEIDYTKGELAKIAGHYNFSRERISEIKEDVLKKSQVSLDKCCTYSVEVAIRRYLNGLRGKIS